MTASNKKRTVDIICPVFNEEETLPIFYKKINEVLLPLENKYSFNFIFTNNASTDQTLHLLQEMKKIDSRVNYITLSRNFGYQCSLLSGLNNSTSDAVIIIDVDGEDPPELIPQFLNNWEKGYDVVYGLRGKRPESILIQGMRKLFYRLTRSIADSEFILDMAEFMLLTKRVRKILIESSTTFPFIRSEIGYLGFRRKAIPYSRQKRLAGNTNYNLLGMTQFAVGGILSSSTFPLRAATYVGVPVILYNLFFVLSTTFGFTWINSELLSSFNFSFLTIFLAVNSIYLARIYKDGIKRPRFIIDWENSTVENLSLEEYENKAFTYKNRMPSFNNEATSSE